MDKKKVTIENKDGTTKEVELITYLVSEDQKKHYIVYSKGEAAGNDGDEIIYISRIVNNNNTILIEEIKDDAEWSAVQLLLKKIANS
ncbi:MAG: DUF1292 domain-containing protein [Bacilli bacterium]|nr:DUF1292 domain-containing protein [Bacilli bacterium]